MKIHQAGKIGAMTIALGLCGCGNGAQDALALKIELTALKQELEYVRLQTEDLQPRVRVAEQMAMQVFDERDAPVRLDCAHHSPAVLSTRAASVTAVCEEAVRHAGGYRIRLKLGNPMSAHLDGLTLTFYAGEDASRGRSDRRLYHEARVALAPGAWKTVDVDFAGLDEESVRELAVRANAATIALAGK
jgi:hypothetical protein